MEPDILKNGYKFGKAQLIIFSFHTYLSLNTHLSAQAELDVFISECSQI